ncbi:MAG: hypothetical protein COB51_13325 [Moraxellaceae bacterium]|nr:MAG: hypothetical protein COB51_13325 [Moraxellaceae bacterium]
MKLFKSSLYALLALTTSCAFALNQESEDITGLNNSNLINKDEIEKEGTRANILAQARKCSNTKPWKGRGVHGSSLIYTKAVIKTAADMRAQNGKNELANLNENFRFIFIPESPPMDKRIPNGIHIILNIETGECDIPSMR